MDDSVCREKTCTPYDFDYNSNLTRPRNGIPWARLIKKNQNFLLSAFD